MYAKKVTNLRDLRHGARVRLILCHLRLDDALLIYQEPRWYILHNEPLRNGARPSGPRFGYRYSWAVAPECFFTGADFARWLSDWGVANLEILMDACPKRRERL